ncbi:MAG: hypothetical protein HY754_07325 [Nitrospirae bacterium]|nr:hypothetical protein [Nitrospirota bacterium]
MMSTGTVARWILPDAPCRCRRLRRLTNPLDSNHELGKYPKKGKYTACVKVVDIFGCDTSITVEVVIV